MSNEITQADRELLEQHLSAYAPEARGQFLPLKCAALRAIAAARRQAEEAQQVCGEAYQVVGCLLSDTGQFDTEHGQNVLDNLSQHKMVHDNVLPWDSKPCVPSGGEVVGVVDGPDRGGSISQSATLLRPMPSGTKLYTAPTSAPVGVEEMLAVAEKAWNDHQAACRITTVSGSLKKVCEALAQQPAPSPDVARLVEAAFAFLDGSNTWPDSAKREQLRRAIAPFTAAQQESK